jgi:hypothetical protein
MSDLSSSGSFVVQPLSPLFAVPKKAIIAKEPATSMKLLKFLRSIIHPHPDLLPSREKVWEGRGKAMEG